MWKAKVFVVAVGVLVVAFGLSMSAGVASGASEGAEPAGKTAFLAHKCNMCHAVPAAGIEAKMKSDKVPALGGKVEGDVDTIMAFVRKAGELDGKEHKKEFKGTDEELQTILDWLGSLEAQE